MIRLRDVFMNSACFMILRLNRIFNLISLGVLLHEKLNSLERNEKNHDIVLH